ncbi:MAG: heavy metal translocating P-type ATPase, partial [Candidatus Nanopelagicales bacterium]
VTDRSDFVITGMSCASCALRVERKLNKLPGIEASVNYATGIAHIESTSAIDTAVIQNTVSNAGYGALVMDDTLGDTLENIEKSYEQDLFRRWTIGALFALPITLIAMFQSLQFQNWQYVTLVGSLVVVLYSAFPLHKNTWRNARTFSTSMDTLVSLGVFAALFGSLYQIANHPIEHLTHLYIDVAVVVPTFVLFGRWLETRGKRKASASLQGLLNTGIEDITVLRNNEKHVLKIRDIQENEIVICNAESTIPIDGIVVEGTSTVSNAMLTGETLPKGVSIGDEVFAGGINHEGVIQVRTTAAGSRTRASEIGQLVRTALSRKASVTALVDRISARFVPGIILLAVSSFVAWQFIDANRALDILIAVLVIACPCALGLATPMALVAGMNKAASEGIVFSGHDVIEKAVSINTIVFDKTGTLTTGSLSVTNNTIPSEFHTLIHSLASQSLHPISRAVSEYFKGDVSNAPTLQNIELVPGLGVKGTYEGKVVNWGSRNWVPGTSDVDSIASYLFVDNHLIGYVALQDVIRPNALQVIHELDAIGIQSMVATGDSKTVASSTLQSLMPIDIKSDLLPQDKIDIIHSLQQSGESVAMVGDGTNDAPALAASDIGISMPHGTVIAQSSADISLMRDDLSLVLQSLTLARRINGFIRSNLFWAFAYNVIAIPFAILGLLPAMYAGIAMSLSSVFVVLNSLRLLK